VSQPEGLDSVLPRPGSAENSALEDTALPFHMANSRTVLRPPISEFVVESAPRDVEDLSGRHTIAVEGIR
jgi:hypothetical protein